jgi:hypothetical protein
MAMERDDLPRTVPRHLTRTEDELKRNALLARYDSHPGIAVVLLAVMAFLFIVVTYQWVSDSLDDPAGRDKRVQIQPKAPSP